MNEFDILLQQCEKQAEKLCSIEIDDEYISEIDVFNNYFGQLKQIIDAGERQQMKEKVNHLLSLMNSIIERIQQNQQDTSSRINNLLKNKNMVGYGAVKHQFAHRINRRY